MSELNKTKNSVFKSRNGFTLIELIIVIAVLGVLASLVIPSVIGVKKEAEETADDTNKIIVENALERYYAKEGEYPEKLSDLVPNYIKQVPDSLAGTYNPAQDRQSYDWNK
jgi:general secretion pathway protein G